MALSVVLLMGAGVMLRSLLALRNVDAGFNPRNVLTLRVSLPETRYTTPAQISAFFDTALQRIRALPGVQAAGAIDDLPTQGGSRAADRPRRTAELLPRDQPTVEVRKITPGYLQRDEHSGAARTRRRGQRRGGHAGQPRRREAAVGRRRSDRPPRHAAAPVEDGLQGR